MDNSQWNPIFASEDESKGYFVPRTKGSVSTDIRQLDDYDPYDYLNEAKTSLFKYGQSYSDGVAATLQCKTCGSTEFNVGRDSYYTAIRCPKCGWEECIHSG